jgi:hypothetical protein
MTTTADEPRIQTFRRRTRVGVNIDGEPRGWATKQPGRDQWSAFVKMPDPPFDAFFGSYPSADDAVIAIAKHFGA